jgi:D-amino-acid dehydrogenase
MKHVTIVGGGIIGLCTAYYLQQAGSYQITVIEQGQIGDGCSTGNAGMIVPSHIVPLAQPGMIAKGMRWMFSQTSPFYVRPRLSADLLRWGWLFYRHANADHVARAIPALRDISLLSKTLYQQLAGTLPDFGWHERGLLMLYKTAAAEHEMAHEADIANQAGIVARVLAQADVQALEPDVRLSVRGAVYYPGDAHLNPGLLLRALATYLKGAGVRLLEQTSVTGFQTTHSQLTYLETTAGPIATDEVVLAGGAWSPELAAKLGVRLPLQGGKGYSFMLNGPAPNLRVPAIMLEARATATPVGADLRFAGTLEVAGTDLTINLNRVRGIAESISQYYPDLPVTMPTTDKVWRGLRPCSPDGLPYIGRVGTFENLTVATGHGMMGLSLGPATGKLVAELLTTDVPTSMDTAPFRVGRF